MKFTITFKTPDAVDEAVQEYLSVHEPDEGWTETEECEVEEELRGTFEEFIKFGEYVTIEFDTETRSATVLKATNRRGR